MKIYMISLIFLVLAGLSNPKLSPPRILNFSYSLLSNDTLSCKYHNIYNLEYLDSSVINLGMHGKIWGYKQRIRGIDDVYYYSHNFATTDSITKYRDAVELFGVKYKLDSLENSEGYSKEPYFYSALINMATFTFKNRKYLAFFFQNYAYPVTYPNTSIFLFDITNRKKVIAFPSLLQASEDMKCFNDFDKNGKLDFADWRWGSSFEPLLCRYEMSKNNEFIKTSDYVSIYNPRGFEYYVNIKKTKWPYGALKKLKSN